jgi:hypothetical protein
LRPLIWVRLSDRDQEHALATAAKRNGEANRMGLPDKHGFQGDGETIHSLGALGELAVALALGRKWDASVNTFKRGGDVGEIQVRTRSEPWHDLIVREDDRNEDTFVLVNGSEAPRWLEVVGWTKGLAAKRDAFLKSWGGREAAYFVPRSALKSLP